jgi:hypothetical protein
VSTHEPPQLVSPGPQAAWQTPALHTVPAPHGDSHAPQWCGSLLRSTQTPEQLPIPRGQVQLPPMQALPPVQAWPQAPQCTGSPWRSTHAPLQLVSPAAQAAEHAPFEHTLPCVQTSPHSPQLAGSLAIEVH